MEEDSIEDSTLDETDNDSAEITRQCICSALQESGDTSYITAAALRRPTFALLQRVVASFCQDLHFAEGLYNDTCTDAGVAEPTTRKDKISFLVKILAVVSILIGERHDVYVSPAKILCGEDVVATHRFLLALAGRACKVSPEQSKEAAAQVLAIGETALYKRAVRARKAMVKLQGICRGRLIRQRQRGGDKDQGGVAMHVRTVNSDPGATTDVSFPNSAAPAATAVALDVSDDELSLSTPDEDGVDGGDDGQRTITSQDSQDARGLTEELQMETKSGPSESSAQSIPPESSISSSTKVYVGLDGKMKVAAKEEKTTIADAAGASSSSSSSSANMDETPSVPQHDQVPEGKTPMQQPHASKQKKSSLPKRPVPTRIRNNRSRQTADACTSCELDNVAMMRDMSDLHVKQLQHRESVEVFRKAEVNLKARVQRTTEKELELKRKEAELKDREDRVTRVAESLRKQQHTLKQKEDALKAHQANGRKFGSAFDASTGKANNEPKPAIDPSIVAEIKGLKRKLFRSERRVQRREDQIRALFKRLSRLSKVHQRLVEETKANGSEEEANRSSWLIERSTNSNSAGSKRGAGANRKEVKKKTPLGVKKRQDLTTDQGSIEKKTTQRSQPPTAEKEDVCASTGGRSERQSNMTQPTGKTSVSFSPNVEVTRIPPPPPSPVGTPTRTRRVAYMQQAKAEIIPLSSEKIRQSLA